MSDLRSAIYHGEVVHKRLRPVRHELRYRVFSLLLDIDGLSQISTNSRWFSYNRWNLLSVRDCDHGDGSDRPIAEQVWKRIEDAGLKPRVDRVFMLCYPRLLGYVFNPMTTYLGFNADGQIAVMLYEVNNTFGGRKTYLLPAKGETGKHGALAQTCAKQLYVSPFNQPTGRYGFRVKMPGEALSLGVTYRDKTGPVMKAYFAGRRSPLSDAMLFSTFFKSPFQSLKVISGIHFEALRLWMKGLHLVPRKKAIQTDVPKTASRLHS